MRHCSNCRNQRQSGDGQLTQSADCRLVICFLSSEIDVHYTELILVRLMMFLSPKSKEKTQAPENLRLSIFIF